MYDDYPELLEKGKCKDCRFCFSDTETSEFICADVFYGQKLTKYDLKEKKDCFTEGLESYYKRWQKIKNTA